MKYNVLIVEDEAILYDGLRTALEKERFIVDEYTKSYNEAIKRIVAKTPDIVLLDIDLKGEKDGLDLGKVLSSTYKIPFIYITNIDNETTFQQGLKTNHQHYIVKTKPSLNTKEIIRTIHTVLNRTQQEITPEQGLMGTIDFKENIRNNYSTNEITRFPINFEDIIYITNKDFTAKNGKNIVLQDNYSCIVTKNKQAFYASSLRNLMQFLPVTFVRVSANFIINLEKGNFDGLINGAYLSINNTKFKIEKTYKKEVQKRIASFYLQK
ncbi:response regulator [Lutibacter sp.]|uniref:response regulator transcription factor n=1 Tax=Lutibacter sp. TaxID=1925666 RepID=UPI0025C51CE5|nr:response regulator [Lutibacter sp.]MCF6169074.1 response regulator [Lutibacter sp.]